MTNTQLLLTLILIQQGLVGVVWLGAAALGLARRPALHFGLAAGLVAASLALVVQRDAGIGLWLGYGLPNLCGVAAYALLRRGVQVFCGLRTTDGEHLAVVGAVALALLGAITTGQPLWLVFGITSVGLAWSMLRAGAEALIGLRDEFGRVGAIACAAPLLGIGALFALRALLLQPLFADQVGTAMATGGVFNAALGLATLALSLLQNLGLGAMVVSRTVSQLQRLSDHDALTGLLNRRGLAAQHERERSRLRRGGGGHALLQVDIDHFKRINDVHGHAAGDLALVAVARRLKAALRPHDLVARTGGEEFCALLPAVDPATALRVAQRMRESVRGTAVDAGGIEMSITCSIGVAWTCDADETLDHLGRRADAALYHAKDQGRDRVVSATAAA